MIRVQIWHEPKGKSKLLLSEMRIHRVSSYDNSMRGDYSVETAVERGTAVGLYTRQITNYSRLRYNVLGLVLRALEELPHEALEMEDGVSASDLARRQSGIMSALQAGPGKLRRYRHTFWGEASLDEGD